MAASSRLDLTAASACEALLLLPRCDSHTGVLITAHGGPACRYEPFKRGEQERHSGRANNIAVWSAIFGLVGVIVGALLALWSQYVLERRRERRTIRGIARLVQDELREGLLGVKPHIGRGHSWWRPLEDSRAASR